MDEIFFVNMLMNAMLLYMVGKFRGLAATGLRIAAAAASGAFGIVILCFLSLPSVLEMLITLILLPMSMVFIAFHIKNIKSNILNLITLYLNSAMIGGMLQIIFYHSTLKNCLYLNHQNRTQGIAPVRLVTGSLMTLVFVALILKLYRYRCHIVSTHCIVQLVIHGQKIKANGLVDTGNGLYEPISHQPVCMIYYPLIKNHIEKIEENTLRMVPVRTIDGGQGMLCAFLIDQMDIWVNQWHGHFEKIYVALNDREFGGCQVLLHPEFVRDAGMGS